MPTPVSDGQASTHGVLDSYIFTIVTEFGLFDNIYTNQPLYYVPKLYLNGNNAFKITTETLCMLCVYASIKAL